MIRGFKNATTRAVFEGEAPEEGGLTMTKKLPPMHPGEVLREEFLVPLKLSAGALAKKMDVPRTRIERIADETTGITADTALRLGKALGTTPQFWLNLQNDYDLQTAVRAIGKKLKKIEPAAGTQKPKAKSKPPHYLFSRRAD
jgi:antitoxin HigA-1